MTTRRTVTLGIACFERVDKRPFTLEDTIVAVDEVVLFGPAEEDSPSLGHDLQLHSQTIIPIDETVLSWEVYAGLVIPIWHRHCVPFLRNIPFEHLQELHTFTRSVLKPTTIWTQIL
jgi:hypothetical protein